METLIEGGVIEKRIDEQIVYNELEKKENAIWSLLLASGYLRVVKLRHDRDFRKVFYTLKFTNKEVQIMFESMIEEWFDNGSDLASDFIEAMLAGDIYAMTRQSARFYHGFVLGLMVDKRDDYIIKSNRESGFGRYDVMMTPRDIRDSGMPALILEFKVVNHSIEKSLEQMVKSALRQIEGKKYDMELLKAGVKKENIRHYGFAFEGKKY